MAGNDEATVQQAVAALLAAFEDQNATAEALAAAMGEPPAWQALSCVPFSSARKWSGATFAEHGTIVLGAPETLLADQHKTILNQAADYAAEGHRVVLAATSATHLNTSDLKDDSLPAELKPLALLLLTDGIRSEARAALQFFAENDVVIKIISGDNPRTVARVASQLGLAQADQYIDATAIADNEQAIEEAVTANAIFGRVTPRLKQQMVAALKRRGHTVAMTGDGVNDVLALRESDCSVVVASGSEAAKNTANILLVNSDFLVLPDVVRAGRQVINNLGRVASLFLNKTAYAFGVSLLFLVLGFAYPFKPIQQSLLGSFSIGTPAFFLALEPNTARVKPGFLSRIIRFALPGGITVTFFLLLIQLFYQRLGVNKSQVQLLMVLVTAFIVWIVLIRVSWPLTLTRLLVITAMALLFIAEAIIFASFLEFPVPDQLTLRVFMVAMPLSLLTQQSLAWLFDRIWPDKSLADGATPALG
ncbi:MAG: HAD-IC family P-type ATPase [Saccharofermentanales bacterium]